jgi:N-acetylneuraminic acid mutarotase
LDGYIYAVGGYGDDGGRVDSVERYDETTKTWTSMPGLHEVRSALGCDALDGKIYVAGGYGPGSQPQSLVDMVEVFDPKTKHWDTVDPLNIPRAHVCCVTYQNKLWAVGGYDGQKASQTVEIYDPKTKRWTEGPKLIKKRSVVVCSVLDDKLYAIGGYDGQNYLSCSEVYDPVANQWVPGPDMTVSRGRHCVCTLPF